VTAGRTAPNATNLEEGHVNTVVDAPARPVARIGVVGTGVMGAGLAEAYARAGLDVRVIASGATSARTGADRVARSLAAGVRRGRITEDEAASVRDRIGFGTDLTELGDRDLVIEAVPENESLKLEIFGMVDKVVEDDLAILASNTSSIPITRLARATVRPGRVVGMHFFNPVPAMPLVELTGSLHTDDAVLHRAHDFLERTLGKEVVRSRDRAGFVVNALLIPYLLSAARMLESGFADAADIDRGMTMGCGHPMGPLALCDLIGLDVVAAVAGALWEEFKEPHYAPPSLLLRMVEGGLLGRKNGRGFFSYS
jgi:3-hydroxybutyryl-CoA dehydrogenase